MRAAGCSGFHRPLASNGACEISVTRNAIIRSIRATWTGVASLSLHPVDNRCARFVCRVRCGCNSDCARSLPIFFPLPTPSLARALAFLSFRAREQLDGCYNIRLVIRQQEAGSRKQEAGSRKQEAGSRKQEAGSRQQAAGSRHAVSEGWLRPIRAFNASGSFRGRFEPFASGLLRSVRWDRSVEIDQFL